MMLADATPKVMPSKNIGAQRNSQIYVLINLASENSRVG